MTESWASLYSPCADAAAAADALVAALTGAGYTRYDPFSLIPGKAYPVSVRLFVAPVAGPWVRVIGALPADVRPALGARLPACYLALLADGAATIDCYADGASVEPAALLADHLRAGCTAADLARALAGELPVAEEAPATPFDHLPDEVRGLSERVNPKQAQRMFDRLSGSLLGRAGAGAAGGDAARDLLSGPDWNSAGGRRIRALMSCLDIPADWREPDFVTLRDAYQLHHRRQRKPDARLYPGDEDVMNRVPAALDYTPIYAGKDA